MSALYPSVALLHDAAPLQSGSAVAAQQRQDGSRRQQQQQQTADCRNISGGSSGCGSSSSSGSSSGSCVTKQTAWGCGPVVHAARRTETMQIRETIAVCVVKIGAAFVEIE